MSLDGNPGTGYSHPVDLDSLLYIVVYHPAFGNGERLYLPPATRNHDFDATRIHNWARSALPSVPFTALNA
jgi:hypothetical protein